MVKPVDKEDLDHILNHTEFLWEELRDQNIFMTGGTGFIGCWLLESFIAANEHFNLNAKVTVLTRNPDAFTQKAPHLALNQAISMIKGDVRDFDFPEGKFSFVIHAATESSVKLNTENPLLMFETIVNGTQRTLEFARTHGTSKFLLTSSGAVYGKQPSNITNVLEDHLGAPYTMEPNAAYGEGKRTAEMFCILYAQKFGIETKIARLFAFVGPYLPLDAHFAIGNFIRDACQGGPVCVKGDGTPYRSYLYAADMAIWLWTILFRGKASRPYNVGSENSINIADLAGLVCSLAGPGMDFTVARQADPVYPPERYIPSIERARSELGIDQLISLDEAIKRTMQWLKPKSH